ncbi:MAG TPA: aminotransferase class V-fold PLP-dependent enzyme [Mycobacteriales bacterium]|nr:aminotransferase class V-fold PLP-dependent enzyme [Mycobacteriales bacterium]
MTDVTEWMLDPEVAYLNQGAFGALPRVVWDAASELRQRMERDPTQLLVRSLPGQIDEVRARLSQLFNADEAGAVFVPNATGGTQAVIASLSRTFEPGDELLTTDHRYAAVLAQFIRTASERGTKTVVAHVPLDAQTTSDVVNAIVERITPRTKLLVVDSIASLSGFVFPLVEIVAAAHERGVPVLVDAAHAPGQLAVDLTRVGADFWVGNLHKWICSPRAAAYLHVAPQWRDTVRPLAASHGYAGSLHDAFDWTGTFDPVTILAVPAALDFWERKGWNEIRGQQRAIVDDGAVHVATALGTNGPVGTAFRAAMRIIELPVQLAPGSARDVESALAEKYRVETSLMPLHGKSWVRVCGQIYNTPDDYERLADALTELLESE